MIKSQLIIFIKNPVLGKVKTRLAATLGPEKALSVYQHLLNHTRAVTQKLPFSLALYYSDFIPVKDEWDNQLYRKYLQTGEDLGQKMKRAFEAGFKEGYNRICIIGSDCFDLATEHIIKAFEILEKEEVVIGPAEDGGYYLLGMKAVHKTFFKNKKWSTDSVLPETLQDIRQKNLSLGLLPTLTDVDEEKDLPPGRVNIATQTASI